MLEHLFKSLPLGPVEIRNRIVSTAHQTGLVEGNLPTDDFLAYHRERAEGGVGLIVLEATAVHETGLLTAHTLAGYREEIVPAWKRLVAAIHPYGTRLCVQLFHSGRELIASSPRPPALAPSAVPSLRFHSEPRALRAEEIEAIVAGYGVAAALAAEGGLDGVEISAAHNYLIAQFLSPELNRRRDVWAPGPRLLVAVVDRVRAAAPGLAVGVRLSADLPGAREAAAALAERVDFLSVALGESSTYLGSSDIVPPPPVPENAIEAWTGPFRVGPPLIAATRVVDPVEADRMIREGRADAVGMTRALITDPELPRKAAAGRLGDVLRCLGCNACIAHYHAGTPIACSQNPRAGRERTLPRPERSAQRRRVVVVGAGPAGLAAASEAGALGHEVILLERSGAIGGQLALAAAAPAHAETAGALQRNYERLLVAGAVEVRLETEAGVEEVASLSPAAVVVATGARPYQPSLPLEGVEVVQAWRLLEGPCPRGRRVVVADWGGDPSGLACAEILASAGNDVTLAVASVAVGEGMHQYSRNLYLSRLYRAGVRLEHHWELVEAAPGRVRFRNVFCPEQERDFPADLLVLALGRVPADELAMDLRACGLDVHEAGDCRSPRSAEEAILEGTLAARRATGGG